MLFCLGRNYFTMIECNKRRSCIHFVNSPIKIVSLLFLFFFSLNKTLNYILATSSSMAIGLNASADKITPNKATKAETKHSVTIYKKKKRC